MNIYRFANLKRNYLDGYWYFAAESKERAINISKQFQKQRNLGNNQNYTVEFNEEPQEFEILNEGYLPLNRS